MTGLPEPEWVPEIGMAVANSGDLGTALIILTPKRLSAEVVVTNQLLITVRGRPTINRAGSQSRVA